MTEVSLSDVVPGSPQGPRRRTQRAAEKRRKKRRRRTWVTVLITVVVLGAAGTAAWFGLRPIVVGVCFGMYPALRASRLSPIDAIRHE